MLRLLFFMICFTLVWQPGDGLSREIVDQAGRSVTVPDTIRRVVSLAPSITEIVFSLGREDLLKGATQYSDNPPEAKSLPRVGSYVRIDIEKVVALQPDICLAIKDGNPLHTVSRIESLGIPVYVVDPHSLDEIMEMITGLGDLLDAEQRAAEITDDMHRRVDRVTEKLQKEVLRPRVFFQIDAEPIISAGKGTFIHELITMAGGRNVAADASTTYPKFSWEDILHFRPDVAIIATMAGGYSEETLKAGWSRWPQLPAVRNNNVHVVDAGLVDRPTPRLVEGLETFARIIHPEIFNK